MHWLRKLWEFTESDNISLRTVPYVRSEDNPAGAPSRLKGPPQTDTCLSGVALT